MDNLKKELPSGAMLEMSLSSFEDGTALMKAVLREAERIKIDFGDADISSLANLDMNSSTMNTMKNYLSRMISSDEVEACLWACLKKGIRNNQPITKDTFEDHEARGDYLVILKEALIFNLSPFFQNLGSMLKDIQKATKNGQK